MIALALLVPSACVAETVERSEQELFAISEFEPLPGCDADAEYTVLQQAALGLAMATAYGCSDLTASDYLNYGCFCGPGNTGIDTAPADDIDACCQQHDVDWWAICQNIPEDSDAPPDERVGCDCYRHMPQPTCVREGGATTGPGTLEWPDDLDACAQACADEMESLVACTAGAGEPDPDLQPGGPIAAPPLDGEERPFCQETIDELPESDFGEHEIPDVELQPAPVSSLM